MGDKHSKKTQASRPENGHGAAPAQQSPELRARIEALAEQVRRLSVRGEAVAAVATAPVRTAAPAAVPTPAPAAGDPVGVGAGLLAVDVIAIAERTAAEIRERAAREAERIRGERRRPPPAAGAAELFAVLRRQHATLAVLAAETDRLEQSAEILRAQLRVLEAEIAAAYEILGTPPHPPARDVISAPAA